MKKVWFKAKKYGYGWTPATWEGWVVLAIFLGLVFLNIWMVDPASSDREVLVQTIPVTIVLIVILIFVCVKKGEKPRWRWGDTDKK